MGSASCQNPMTSLVGYYASKPHNDVSFFSNHRKGEHKTVPKHETGTTEKIHLLPYRSTGNSPRLQPTYLDFLPRWMPFNGQAHNKKLTEPKTVPKGHLAGFLIFRPQLIRHCYCAVLDPKI